MNSPSRTRSPAKVPAPVLASLIVQAKDNPFNVTTQDSVCAVSEEMEWLADTMMNARVNCAEPREARAALRVAAQRLVRYTALYRAISLGDSDGGMGDALYHLCRELRRQGLSDRTRNHVNHAQTLLR